MGAMTVYTARDDADEDEGVKEAKCSFAQSEGSGCYCGMSVNHFTSYMVVEETSTSVDVQEEAWVYECPWVTWFMYDGYCDHTGSIIVVAAAVLVLCVACICVKRRCQKEPSMIHKSSLQESDVALPFLNETSSA